MRVRFGECVLDSDTRQLSVRGRLVHLTPKAFQFLELLLENRLKVFSKSEISNLLTRRGSREAESLRVHWK
jgi:DNA-binding winged helix-turn-helix (wHTH) protein